MSRRQLSKSQTDAPGQDSFLDIVANLVGILLILIMVVGLRTKDAIVQASQEVAASAEQATDDPSSKAADDTADQDQQPDLSIDVEGAQQAAQAVERSLLEIDQRIKRQDLEAEFRRRERERIQLLILTAERKLQDTKQELTSQQQQDLQQQQAVLDAEREMDRLQTQLQALTQSSQSVEQLDHLPTPMAKTVFGKEVHFRLQGNRLAMVPWDELVLRLKDDAPNKIWKLKETDKITETIGPLEGFRLRYTLKKSEQMVKVDGATAMQQRASLDFFHLIPIQDQLGDLVHDAMSNPNSQLNNVLGSNDPKSTTVTVWVYPNSFEAFRELKLFLFQRGFLTASRPMPAGRYMGGAPDGQRSAAE